MSNTLYDALFAEHLGNQKTFLITDDGAHLSYDAFIKRSAQIAHVLIAAGVQPGDRVLAQVPKVADTICLFAATVQVGGVYLPLNTAYTESELSYFINDAAPKVIVCDARDEAQIANITRGIDAKVLTLAIDGGSLVAAADDQPQAFATVSRNPDDLAALLYTSGTTGRSKGAMLSHKNLLSNAVTLTDLWQITDQDRLIHALPIFHTHGLFVALNTALLAGAEVRFMATFDTDAIISALPDATMLMGVPTFYTRLLADPRFEAKITETMRLFISGSAPLLAETHTAFEARTGHRILERYGMTETNMITSNPYDGARVAGTVGFALPDVEVRITDPDSGAVLDLQQIGMIEVRGDNVFQGYWKMPEKTAEELRDNGFFITGDLGTMDDTGRVAIVGRSKDLIIAGGYNIYPKELEDVLNDLDGVLESAVFGVPHPDFGESVLAAVVPEPDTPLDPNVIRQAVEVKLARFKHPRRYILLEELPRNTMGKVQKNVLKDRFAD